MKKFKNKKWISIALATTLAAAGISALAIACHDTKGKDGTQPENGKNVQAPKNGPSRNNQKQVIIQPKQPNQNNLDKKPVVTLDANTKLIKRTDNKYELKFNITNEENKLVKVELTPVISATSSTSSIFSDFATVSNQRVTAVFSNLDEKNNYLVKSINVYNSKKDNKPVKIELDSKTTSLKLTFDKPKVSTPAPSLQGDQEHEVENKKQTNHKHKHKNRPSKQQKLNVINFVKDESDRKLIYNSLKEKLIGKTNSKYNWFDSWNFNDKDPFDLGPKPNDPIELDNYIVKTFWLSAIYSLEENYREKIGLEEYNKIVDKLYKYLWTDVNKKDKNKHIGPYYDLDRALRELEKVNGELEEELLKKYPKSSDQKQETENNKTSSPQTSAPPTSILSNPQGENKEQKVQEPTQSASSMPKNHQALGHVHGNPWVYTDDDDEKETKSLEVKAGLSFENDELEVMANKKSDFYEFKVKFEKPAAGYTAILTLGETLDKNRGSINTEEVKVKDESPITLKIPASDIDSKKIKKLHILKVGYEDDDFNFSSVDLSSKNLVLTFPSTQTAS